MTQSPSAIDIHAFRQALGCFATGITVVTCAGEGGGLHGVTANSFSSVSLQPALVLWSLSRESSSFTAFGAAQHFAIHVLRQNQLDLSNHFARSGERFANIEYSLDRWGVPELADYLARFSCRAYAQHDGGDHVIHLGAVIEFDHIEDDPLLFVQGEYGACTLHPDRVKDYRKGQIDHAPADMDDWW